MLILEVTELSVNRNILWCENRSSRFAATLASTSVVVQKGNVSSTAIGRWPAANFTEPSTPAGLYLGKKDRSFKVTFGSL
jgi:hypothetical protein